MTGEGSGSGPGTAPDSEELEGIPSSGHVIAGKFIVEQVLGIGGMGVVVSAKHMHLGQKVAIKFLRKDAAKSQEAINRFLREARSAVGLQSAHVVRVMDVGVLEDGMPYMVMEHLQGTDLNRVLEQRKTLPAQEAVDYVLQGMEAIAEAHALGIVHRDLKPANLFLTRSPDGSPLVKVLDFGISKSADSLTSQQQSLTATSAIMGSPLYMSPEQLRSSKNVDVRTDVWALGVIVYELLAGVPPFEADTVTGLCAKIAADPATPLRSVNPGISVALEAVVMRCLEKDMAKRYATVADLALSLHPFGSTEGKRAAERIARIAKPAGSSGSFVVSSGEPSVPGASSGSHISTGYAETQANWQTMGAQRRRRNTTLVFVGVGALAVGSLVAVLGYRSTHPKPSAAAAADIAPPALSTIPSASAPVTLAPPPGIDPSASASAPAAPSASAPPVVVAPPPARPGWGAPARPAQPKPAPAPAQPKPDDLLLDRK
ncbi:MAG TPA: serine/threonine-protein kinase [Polyangiaceae bacterium]